MLRQSPESVHGGGRSRDRETLDNAHLMRLAGRFSRCVRGYARAHDILVIDCIAGERKHDVADEHLAKTAGQASYRDCP